MSDKPLADELTNWIPEDRPRVLLVDSAPYGLPLWMDALLKIYWDTPIVHFDVPNPISRSQLDASMRYYHHQLDASMRYYHQRYGVDDIRPREPVKVHDAAGLQVWLVGDFGPTVTNPKYTDDDSIHRKTRRQRASR